MRLIGYGEEDEAARFLSNYIWEKTNHKHALIGFNDSHSHKEVIAMVKGAIREAKRQAGVPIDLLGSVRAHQLPTDSEAPQAEDQEGQDPRSEKQPATVGDRH